MQYIIFHKLDPLSEETPGLWFDSCIRPPTLLGGRFREVRLYLQP